MTAKVKVPTKLKPFMFHGAELQDQGSGQWVGSCVFCEKRDHFYANPKTGQWDCKRCGERGNLISFLTKLAKTARDVPLDDLAEDRKIPVSVLRKWDVGFHNGQYTIPVYTPKTNVKDIRVWAPKSKTVKSTWGCRTSLYNGQAVQRSKASAVVYICEGEWDAMALDWFMTLSGKVHGQDYVVVAAPGANVWKPAWNEIVQDRRVILMYDADRPGYDGMKRTAKMIRHAARKVEYVWWPSSVTKGFDVRDFVVHGMEDHLEEVRTGDALNALMRLVNPRHPEYSVTNVDDAYSNDNDDYEYEDDDNIDIPPDDEVTFDDVLFEMEKIYDMNDDMRDAMELACAVVFANRFPNCPMLWVYLVSPPGGGKTAVLNMFRESSFCVFRSSLTPASLVSGFRGPGGSDPSLLPKLNRKTAVFKDGTEIITLHHQVLSEIAAVFRGAYDGYLSRSYGNGIVREYKDLHFGLLIGVTPAVYASDTASVGERLLKFQMLHDEDSRQRDEDRATMRALYNVGASNKNAEKAQDRCRQFLWKPIESTRLPRLPKRLVERLMGLSKLVAALRAEVVHTRDGVLMFEPYVELSSRLAQQLSLLCRALAAVHGKKVAGERQWRITRRVGLDTCQGFPYKIVRALSDSDSGSTMQELTGSTGIPSSTVYRHVENLMALRLIERHSLKQTKRGRPANLYRLSASLRLQWDLIHG